MKTVLIIFTTLFALGLQAQQIEGNVYDESNSPLIGANVYIKGTYNGATTDADGRLLLSPNLMRYSS